jgi:hypothetical protein
MLTDIEKGYLAGIIDGEGWIGICKEKDKRISSGYRLRPILDIGNTNIEALENIKTLIGEGYIANGQKRERRKEIYMLRLSPNTMRWLLPEIVDVMKIKQKQAILMIEFLKLNKGSLQYKYRPKEDLQRMEEIYYELKKLNKKG